MIMKNDYNIKNLIMMLAESPWAFATTKAGHVACVYVNLLPVLIAGKLGKSLYFSK